jgi:iron complex outermembrane receptor protein
MTQNGKRALGGALMLTAVAQAVFAQTTPAASETAVPINSITITANKREERLQNVPATASVVQAQQLEQQNIDTVNNLVRAVPTVAMTAGGLSIRGFGGGALALSGEGSIGVLVDGVSLSGAGEFPPNFFDVERVEVLEGPQGTLFGKNSTAGIINIVTRAPSTRAFSGAVRTEVQTRDGRAVQGMLNVPLSETLAIRAAGSLLHDPTTMHNLWTDTRDKSTRENARVRLKWNTTSDVTVNLIADSSTNKLKGGAPFSIYRSTTDSLLTKALTACGVTISDENTDTCANTPSDSAVKIRGLSGQIDWSIGDYTLTSVTARRTAQNLVKAFEVDTVPLPNTFYEQPGDKRYRNLSQEFRIASPDADWGNYVAGIYYFDGENQYDQQPHARFLFAGVFPLHRGNVSHVTAQVKSSAIFGQGTYKVTKNFFINMGARLGQERLAAQRVATVLPGTDGPFPGAAALIPVSGKTKDTYGSWRLGSQYEFTQNNVGYINFVHGYKGPAVNDNASDPSIPLVVRPEIPQMLEAGLKNLFLNGRFGLNVSAYRTKIKDFQATVFHPATTQFVYSNAPAAHTHGISVSFYGKPTSEWTINGGLAYMIAKYGAGFRTACPASAPAGCTRDAEGDQLNGAPRFRFNLTAEYTLAVGAFKTSLAGDVVYQSKQVFNPADPARNFDPRTTLGARVAIRSQDDRLGVALYVRNLLDDFQPVTRNANYVGTIVNDVNSYIQTMGPESRRLVGLTFDAKF